MHTLLLCVSPSIGRFLWSLTNFIFSPQSRHMVHMDWKRMGCQVYLESKRDHFGPCKCNLLLCLYLNDTLWKCTSTVAGCQLALQLWHQMPLSNLPQSLEGSHAQHSSEWNTKPHPCYRSPVLKLSSRNIPLVRSPLRRLTSCGFGRWGPFTLNGAMT